ncbi:hypothetical protein GCM10012275_63310 [Longimycelium tulufanense]|uniref:Secreted protein n=1 Tax=Longimycelium tulufanense TaxID=907463 RepID=A0A8J3CJ35_9PSEU|nr:hypothetical protein [Longimycelium tulufanense]GGM84016.1 hypothetical protein GCM10012275_63310 [Longimycelium tulufanense]
MTLRRGIALAVGLASLTSVAATPAAVAQEPAAPVPGCGGSHGESGEIALDLIVRPGCETILRAISRIKPHVGTGDSTGHFQLVRYGGIGEMHVADSVDRYWNPYESWRHELNTYTFDGEKWCVRFWRNNHNGTWTRIGKDACAHV